MAADEMSSRSSTVRARKEEPTVAPTDRAENAYDPKYRSLIIALGRLFFAARLRSLMHANDVTSVYTTSPVGTFTSPLK